MNIYNAQPRVWDTVGASCIIYLDEMKWNEKKKASWHHYLYSPESRLASVSCSMPSSRDVLSTRVASFFIFDVLYFVFVCTLCMFSRLLDWIFNLRNIWSGNFFFCEILFIVSCSFIDILYCLYDFYLYRDWKGIFLPNIYKFCFQENVANFVVSSFFFVDALLLFLMPVFIVYYRVDIWILILYLRPKIVLI